MTAATTDTMSLRERALELVRMAEAEIEERLQREAREKFERELKELLEDVARVTGGSTSVEVTIESEHPIATTADGLRFSMRGPSAHWTSWNLCVAVDCERNCGKALWINAGNTLLSLGYVLAVDHHHDHDCLQQFDEEGDPITDRWGKPFPAPVEPVPIAETTAVPDEPSIRHASDMLYFGPEFSKWFRRYAWTHQPDTIIVSSSDDITRVSINLTPALIVRVANELLTDDERALIKGACTNDDVVAIAETGGLGL